HAPDRDDRDVLAVLLAQRRVRVRGVDVDLRPRDPRLGAHRLDDGARVVAQVAPRAAVQQDGRGRGVGRAHAPSVRGAAGATAYSRRMATSSGPGPDLPPGSTGEHAPGAGRPAPPPPHRVAAFFDVDNTIIRGASSFHLARALYQREFFSTLDIVRFAVHQARYLLFGENKQQIDRIRSRALALIAGRSVAEVTAIGEEVYDTVLSLRIYPGTRRLLDEHLAAGHQVWLVSATP